MGPLAGIKILDLTSVLMGPYATQALGDMGAEVIKVEAPEGDMMRQIAPARNSGMGAIYLNANRSKRNICLDLKQESGRQVLLRLAEAADVFVYNLRPAAMARLGLDYAALAAANPRIIYAGLHGFGQDGPYAAKPAYDDLIQGGAVMSYLIAKSGDGTPRYVPSAIADRVVGLTAVGHICAAIVHQARTGQGQKIEIPMFETMVSFVLGDHLGGLSFIPAQGSGGYVRQLSPERRPYRTQDGYVCTMIYTDKQWANFLAEIGMADLPQRDPRFASFASRTTHVDEVYGFLREVFPGRTTAEWLALLERADAPAMPMHDFDSILEDPHLRATGFFKEVDHPTEGRLRMMDVPTRWSGTPVELTTLPRRQGEDGIAVLEAAGFQPAEITALLKAGVLRLPDDIIQPLAAE